MKCPDCSTIHKYKEGMVCICGYRFALDPKQPPNISDIVLKNAVDKVSDNHTYYFTYNQLYAQVYRAIKKMKRKERIAFTIFTCVSAGFVLFFFTLAVGRMPAWLYALLIIVILLRAFRKINILQDMIVEVIETYNQAHPIKSLADGKQLHRIDIREFDKDMFQHAPEHILIVERDDIAEMLILNRFYLENKTLVVSANKYPDVAFRAYKSFIAKYPDIPVAILHDASRHGHHMMNRLIEDKAWELEGKNITDLGLSPSDVVRLKRPIWMTAEKTTLSELSQISPGKSSVENIEKGLVMPVDIAPPTAMMGTVTLAVMTGYALLSEELLAEQGRAAVDSGASSGGGYG